MIHESITVYRGDSFRGASDQGLPEFGRFGAIVRRDSFRLVEDGVWYIGLPYGSTICGEGTEEDTREIWQRYKSSLATGEPDRDGWTTDEAIARKAAIRKAADRHNAKVAESAAYAAKFGGIATVV